MSLPPLSATLAFIGLSIAGISTAITKPLVSLSGFYDLHLFPENDQFDYQVSEIHRAAQILHILSLVTLIVSFIMVAVTLFFSSRWSDRAQRDFTLISTATTTAAAAMYITGIALLIKIGVDYKRLGDNIPLPTPEGRTEIGTIMDIVGVLSAVTAMALVMVAMINSKREGFLRLI